MWFADLRGFEGEDDALAALLAPDERKRAGGFAKPLHRDRFVRRRGLMRLILGRYAACDGRDLVFVYNAYGKPSLPQGPCFNLSDSEDHVALAVAHRPLGIDIEAVRPLEDAASLITSYFAPSEAAAFLTIPTPDRPRAFFRAWTQKEAFIKALGLGLSHPFSAFTIDLAAERPAALLEIGGSPDAARAWTLCGLDPGPDCVGALAVKARDVAITTIEV